MNALPYRRYSLILWSLCAFLLHLVLFLLLTAFIKPGRTMPILNEPSPASLQAHFIPLAKSPTPLVIEEPIPQEKILVAEGPTEAEAVVIPEVVEKTIPTETPLEKLEEPIVEQELPDIPETEKIEIVEQPPQEILQIEKLQEVSTPTQQPLENQPQKVAKATPMTSTSISTKNNSANKTVSTSSSRYRSNHSNQGLSNMPARILRKPMPQYPRIAERKGWDGNVILEIFIDEFGTPQEVQVLKSTGYNLLDSSALKWVKSRWKFAPAKLGDQSIASSLKVRVIFNKGH
ncbi:MAG: energy transducer TonB [Verrucomicrobiota bacterium]